MKRSKKNYKEYNKHGPYYSYAFSEFFIRSIKRFIFKNYSNNDYQRLNLGLFD